MTVEELLTALQSPEAFPGGSTELRVVQTHISVVFLVGDRVYKFKKPVSLGFLDFSTAALRRQACEDELRLNRRLAPSVYLGLSALTREADGRLVVDGEGEVVEAAVRMLRLPDEASLASKADEGTLDRDCLRRLAIHLAHFHEQSDHGPEVCHDASLAAVTTTCLENLEQAKSGIGLSVSEAVHARLEALTRSELEAWSGLIESRAQAGIPRDGHGDLRLEHVYQLGSEQDFAVIDCLEFSSKLRHCDPVCDIAFLVMDLEVRGLHELAASFLDDWIEATEDSAARELLPTYIAYRHVVRGKVRTIEAGEKELPEAKRKRALVLARSHFLLALGSLAPPAQRPALVLVGGLPGVGKSTLARQLAETAHFTRVSSDETRKRLAGMAPQEDGSAGFGEGLYTPAWNARTEEACLDEAMRILFEGDRVLIDASFGREALRTRFLAMAKEWGVPAIILRCFADEAVVRQRIDARQGDASDADWDVHVQAAARWEAAGPDTSRAMVDIATSTTAEAALVSAIDALRSKSLM